MTEDGGWYPDPEGVPGRERWWDGTGWTDRTRDPTDELAGYGRDRSGRRFAAPRFAGRRPLVLLGVAGVLALAIVGALVATRGGQPGPTAGQASPGATPGGNPGTTTGAPQSPREGPAPLVCPTGSGSPAAPTPPSPNPPSPTPPSPTPAPPGGGTSPAAAPRVTDREAGISYAGQGRPWLPWRDDWVTPGLRTHLATGYYLVTQRNTPVGPYYATVLSGTVPVRVPGTARDEETRCVAEQIAEDVRAAYYPVPNLRRTLDAHRTTVAGRAGYAIRYHLSFNVRGYDAKGEQVGVLVLDVGRPALAVLYISIPDPVQRFDYVIDQVFDSVRAS